MTQGTLLSVDYDLDAAFADMLILKQQKFPGTKFGFSLTGKHEMKATKVCSRQQPASKASVAFFSPLKENAFESKNFCFRNT